MNLSKSLRQNLIDTYKVNHFYPNILASGCIFSIILDTAGNSEMGR